MSEEPTCGRGLAEHSALPHRMAAVAATMAGVLEHHQTSLDPSDASARPELDAYATLTGEFRDLAASLQQTAARMAGSRDLPMAPHDEAALMTPEAVERFERLVEAERELLRLLEGHARRNEEMLSMMRGPS